MPRAASGVPVVDPFAEKAAAWDQEPVPVQLARGVGAALLARVPLSPELVVLDFGAGTGLLCATLAPHVAHVHAVDVSTAMLTQLAAKEVLRGKVTAHAQDLRDRPLGFAVDLVVSAMALHHVDDTRAMLAALHAHLRPGGRLALADLDAEEGTFHAPGAGGVFHAGFDRGALGRTLADVGCADVRFDTATVVHRDGRDYPVFLVTARRT